MKTDIKKIYSAQGMKAAEREANARGYGYYEMMLAAGNAVAAALPARKEDRVLVLCGTGNNGGDGYVIAQALYEKGISVKIFAAGEPKTPESKRAKSAYIGEYETALSHRDYTVAVECLLGTGFSGEPRGEIKELLEKTKEIAREIPLYSVDIPAGLNADNGEGKFSVTANRTVAVEGYKFGHFLGDGMDKSGTLSAVDIGIGGTPQAALVTPALVKAAFPPLKRNLHKGSHGRATLIAGSNAYTGAANLAAASLSALLTGAGYAELVSVSEVIGIAKNSLPEVIDTIAPARGGSLRFQKKFYAEICARSRVIAVGAGMGVSRHTYRVVRYLIENFTGALIVDADGLNSLAKYGMEGIKNSPATLIFTPHPAEFSRITGKTVKEILAAPYESLTAFSKEYGVTCILKGAATLIAGGQEVYLSTAGAPCMAKGGSGDVLLGVIAGTLAHGRETGLSTAALTAAACYLTGRAGEEAQKKETCYTAIPTDTVRHLKSALKCLMEGEEYEI